MKRYTFQCFNCDCLFSASADQFNCATCGSEDICFDDKENELDDFDAGHFEGDFPNNSYFQDDTGE